MNSVKITYLILSAVSEIFFVCLAVAGPIWITPGVYWWTVFGLIMTILTSAGFTKRLNSWGNFGKVD